MVTRLGRKLTMSDEEFAHRFENKTLKPNMFDHHGHLRLAWYYLTQYDLQSATDRICNSIRNYAEHWGETDKFKKDLTVKIMKILSERYHLNQDLHFEAFLDANPDLMTNMKSLLRDH